MSACETCGAAIFIDNAGTALDVPAVEWDGASAQWTLVRIGGRVFATTGDPSPDGLAHTLHEHQPEGSALA